MTRYRRESPSIAVPATIGTLSLIVLLVWCGVRIGAGIFFDREVEGHLKRAADANQVPLAIEELEEAVKGMDSRGLTCGQAKSCYTSVLYNTPDEDIGFWRRNIEATLADLRAVPEDADHLTVSNTLMKVRETLLDAGESGDHVTDPSGVSIYPRNFAFALVGWLGLLFMVGGFGLVLYRSR